MATAKDQCGKKSGEDSLNILLFSEILNFEICACFHTKSAITWLVQMLEQPSLMAVCCVHQVCLISPFVIFAVFTVRRYALHGLS